MRSGQDLQFARLSSSAIPASNSNFGPIALLMIGIAIPSSLTFNLGDFKFYAARLAVALLLAPAFLRMFRKGRHLVWCDLFTSLASAWMIVSILIAGSYDSMSSTVAIVLEFWGAYAVARGFIFGRQAIEAFVKMLKPVVVIVVAFAVLDQLAGIWVLNAVIGPLVGVPLGWVPEFRGGFVRATSIFPHPILYGTFCAVAAAVFLYARQRVFVGLSLFGCVLAMSSAPFMVSFIVIAVYGYDIVFNRFNWRWKAFTAVVALFFAIIYGVTNNPTSWVISHLTLDPSTGYFREATWDRAFYNIGLSPLTGYGFGDIGDPVVKEFFDNASVDAVWLVLALRFGIPVVPLLLLANISSYYGGAGKQRIGRAQDAYMSNVRTGFTIAVWVLMLAGLTVHYWNSLWLFWGLCLGIRAGFQERGAEQQAARAIPPHSYALADACAGEWR
ncbi:hypothetical protein [Telmatospirillum sp.]|uniref:hypothetical protein n=1 Tax=Telmatospirillum sp. TaxID=2079197 RepID=UPI00284A4D75|nr:hypothetical protein [Telmatospirillum sp.]MDR3437642.1 hypothetical protein [Telmatospirillum sp.]